MDRYKKCGKVNIGLRYFLIVVAFVCCGFVSKSMKINKKQFKFQNKNKKQYKIILKKNIYLIKYLKY